MDVGRLEVLVRQLQGRLGQRRIVGPFTVDSPVLAPGAATGYVTDMMHNLGHTNYDLVPAGKIDLAFGYNINWISNALADRVQFAWVHVGAANNSQVRLKFYVVDLS